MKNFATAITSRLKAGARWYVESCSQIDPAAAMGMFGTGTIAIPLTAGARAIPQS